MKTTIETINGKIYTVIWHSKDYADYLGESIYDAFHGLTASGVIEIFSCATNRAEHIATALPALPRHPKPKDAGLLYPYMTVGLFIKCQFFDCGELVLEFKNSELEVQGREMFVDNGYGRNMVGASGYWDIEITHATDAQGKPVEIAVEDKNNA